MNQTFSQTFVRIIRKAKTQQSVYLVFAWLALVVIVLTFIALVGQLLLEGMPRLRAEFFTNFASRHAERAGILAAWVGSLMVIGVTMITALPLALATGVYLEEYAPKSKWVLLIELNIANLASVPSIIYGLLALGVFVYTLGLGQSVLTAGLTLALLILPMLIVTTREAIRAVPLSVREAAYALGSTRWQTVRHHVLPYASPGILTGVILSVSRALGETAPIITIGALSYIAFLPPPPSSAEFPFINFDWLFAGFTVLPIQMFNWTSRPEAAFAANAAAAGLVLLVLTLFLNAVAIYLRQHIRKQMQW
jgi:phosphate transport system permease protein